MEWMMRVSSCLSSDQRSLILFNSLRITNNDKVWINGVRVCREFVVVLDMLNLISFWSFSLPSVFLRYQAVKKQEIIFWKCSVLLLFDHQKHALNSLFMNVLRIIMGVRWTISFIISGCYYLWHMPNLMVSIDYLHLLTYSMKDFLLCVSFLSKARRSVFSDPKRSAFSTR